MADQLCYKNKSPISENAAPIQWNNNNVAFRVGMRGVEAKGEKWELPAKKPLSVVTRGFRPEHPIHTTLPPPKTHLGFRYTGKRARMTEAGCQCVQGGEKMLSASSPPHTPALNTSLIVHEDRLLARKEQRQFSTRAKHLSFPKCH